MSLPKIILLVISLCAIVVIIFMVNKDKVPLARVTSNTSPAENATPEKPLISAQIFTGGKLTTDTSIHTIPLEKILSGGPGKDGIPALIAPAFVGITEAQAWLPTDADGIVVTIGNTTRFYPYNILVWHEIVNDTIEDTPLVVTFCPLCGSAIVFDARLDGKPEYFGVSGSLYESNLLMYDITTQSLWSQIIGEAVVGTKTGAKLTIIPSHVLTFGEVIKLYPQAKIMSNETGFNRDYIRGPYGDYNTNENIYFPISVHDTSLPTKEVMYIVNYANKSIAFQRNALSVTEAATVIVENTTLKAQIVDGEITVSDQNGAIVPGYTAMWFSWVIHHQVDGIVWKK